MDRFFIAGMQDELNKLAGQMQQQVSNPYTNLQYKFAKEVEKNKKDKTVDAGKSTIKGKDPKQGIKDQLRRSNKKLTSEDKGPSIFSPSHPENVRGPLN